MSKHLLSPGPNCISNIVNLIIDNAQGNNDLSTIQFDVSEKLIIVPNHSYIEPIHQALMRESNLQSMMLPHIIPISELYLSDIFMHKNIVDTDNNQQPSQSHPATFYEHEQLTDIQAALAIQHILKESNEGSNISSLTFSHILAQLEQQQIFWQRNPSSYATNEIGIFAQYQISEDQKKNLILILKRLKISHIINFINHLTDNKFIVSARFKDIYLIIENKITNTLIHTLEETLLKYFKNLKSQSLYSLNFQYIIIGDDIEHSNSNTNSAKQSIIEASNITQILRASIDLLCKDFSDNHNKKKVCFISDDESYRNILYNELVGSLGLNTKQIYAPQARNLTLCPEAYAYQLICQILLQDVTPHNFLDLYRLPILKIEYNDKNEILNLKSLHGIEISFANYVEFANHLDIESAKKLAKLCDQYRQLIRCSGGFDYILDTINDFIDSITDQNFITTNSIYKIQESLHSLRTTKLQVQPYSFIDICTQIIAKLKSPNYSTDARISILSSDQFISTDYNTVIVYGVATNHENNLINKTIEQSHNLRNKTTIEFLRQSLARYRQVYFLALANQSEHEIVNELLITNSKNQQAQKINYKIPLANISVNTNDKRQTQVDFFIDDPSLIPNTLHATAIQKLMQNPEEFFIQHILKLRPLDPFLQLDEIKTSGILLHKLAECTLNTHYDSLSHFEQTLLNEYNIICNKYIPEKSQRYYREIIIPRVAKNLHLYVNTNINQRGQAFNEYKVTRDMTIQSSDKKCVFSISAIIDRLELSYDSEGDYIAKIIDYKSASTPSMPQVVSGLWPQLLIATFATNSHFQVNKFEPFYLILRAKIPEIRKLNYADIQYDIASQLQILLSYYFIDSNGFITKKKL